MQEKPEKWKPPEYYQAMRRKTLRLYCDRHWIKGPNERRVPNKRPIPTRILKPEIQAWLEETGIPHRIKLSGGGKSKIYFENESDAALFKLAWL